MSYYRCGSGAGSGTGQYYVAKVGTGAGTYYISNIYKDYKKLTANNFIVKSESIGGASTGSYSDGWGDIAGNNSVSYARPSVSYNASTGTLTVAEKRVDASLGNRPGVGGYVIAKPEDIYLVVG